MRIREEAKEFYYQTSQGTSWELTEDEADHVAAVFELCMQHEMSLPPEKRLKPSPRVEKLLESFDKGDTE